MIQRPQHRSKLRTAFDLGHSFRVDAVGDQRGADAVSRDVANQNVQAVVTGNDEAIISANGPHRLIVGLHGNVTPSQALRCETLLHAFRELELFFHLALAGQEQGIRLAEVRLGALLFTDVRGGDHTKLASLRVPAFAGADPPPPPPPPPLPYTKLS